MIYRELAGLGKKRLQAAGLEDADTDALILFEHVTGIGRGRLLADGDREASERETDRYELLLEKRAAHIPTQYITGRADFMGLEFIVDRNVLIPRFDTEYLVEEMMRVVEDGASVLDVCTGSGCILLSLMRYKNGIKGTGTDISRAALDIAQQNEEAIFFSTRAKSPRDKSLHNADGLSEDVFRGMHISVDWIQSDMFEKVEGSFDYIVSNPPYIRSEVVDTLMPEVREHEPRIALDGDHDGLRYYRTIAKEAGKHLKRSGRIFLEIGYDQGQAVTELLSEHGFTDVRVLKDYSHNDRVVTARNAQDTQHLPKTYY